MKYASTHITQEISPAVKEKIALVIVKECFWGDYSYSADDVLRIAENGSLKEKELLFGKIISNAAYVSYLLRLFSQNDLEQLFDNYRVTFDKKRITKRINLSRAILLHQDMEILKENYAWNI